MGAWVRAVLVGSLWAFSCLSGLALAADVSAAKAGTHLWTFVPPQGRRCNIVLPLIDKDRAYMAMTHATKDGSQFVYGVDRETGAVLWETDVGGNGLSCAAVQDGRVYVRCTEQHATGSYFLCLDGASGKLLWKQPLDGWNLGGLECETPVFVGNMVLLRGKAIIARGISEVSRVSDDHLYVFDAREGYPLWNIQKFKAELSGFGPLSQERDGRVYFARKHYLRPPHAIWNWSCMLSSFSPSAATIREEFVAKSGIARAVLDPDPAARRVYIEHGFPELAAYDLESGRVLWSIPDVKLQREFVAEHGVVVYADAGGFARCIDGKTGRERWRKYVDKNLEAPLIHKDQVLLSAWKFTTSLSLKDGTTQWEFYTPKAAFAGKPAAEGDLVLAPACYTTEGRSIYAIKLGRPKE